MQLSTINGQLSLLLLKITEGNLGAGGLSGTACTGLCVYK